MLQSSCNITINWIIQVRNKIKNKSFIVNIQEFDYIFGSSFIIRKIDIYEKIVRLLIITGPKEAKEIAQALNIKSTGGDYTDA